MVPLNSQNLIKLLFEFGLLERAALNLVQADSVHEILCPKNPQELAHVELRYKHLLVAFDDFADIARQRIQIAQVQMANLASSGARRFDGRGDGAGSRAPRNDKQVAC